MWITSVLFSSWSAAFEKSFDEWTMILLSPLLISFAQTKALALPPIPWTTPFPWLVAKYFHKKAVLCFLLSDWRNFTMNLFLSSDDGLCDHLICTAPGSSKWLNGWKDDALSSIDDYNIFRADHPNKQKWGGVCIYFKEKLKLKQIITTNISECILCEISMGNKIGYVAVTYHSTVFHGWWIWEFFENFEKLLYQIQQFRSSVAVILGDFNARPKSQWNEDIASNEGSHINSLTPTYGLQQLADPTHILPYSPTCINLIFTDQQNLVDTHPSLHTNCHHWITYCKFNLIVEYLPPYQCLLWDYKRANVDSIKQALYQVNWPTNLSNKDVHQQINILNSIILNVFTNYVSNKVITINEKDPPWMKEFIKLSNEIVFTKLFRIVPRILENIIHHNRLLQKYLTWYVRKRMITTMP